MKTIVIGLFGDYWLNAAEVEQQIRDTPLEETIDLDFQAEGVSVVASGICDCLQRICRDTGRKPETLRLINNPNVLEQTPFENVNVTKHAKATSLSYQPFRSHFLSGDLIRSYWRDAPQVNEDVCLFGLFIGRRTMARDMILRQCLEQADKFLFSMMTSQMGIQTYDESELNEWSPGEDINDFRQWRQTVKIPSLDGMKITDQYRRFVPVPRTNNSILDFYDRFQIELVPETYTRGDTFFPTEKTARPIMACKPILVYGPKHFLARMRDLYGYRTYGDHWDESYDQLEGAERWKAMWNSMQEITSGTMTDEVGAIAQYNREILEKMKEWLI